MKWLRVYLKRGNVADAPFRRRRVGTRFYFENALRDGFRATSAGMTRWTDGLVGGMDDAIARVHNQAYENFYCAGIEAYIGSQIADNATMQNHLLRIAEEDLLLR